MKNLTGAIIAFTFVIASTTNAYAEGVLDKIVSKLELTPQQTIQLLKVQKKRKSYMDEALKVRKQIKALIDVEDVDGAAILAGQQAEKKVRNMHALKTELEGFLTEEQMALLAKARKLMKRKKERLIERKANKGDAFQIRQQIKALINTDDAE